jgi:hypothetical protein
MSELVGTYDTRAISCKRLLATASAVALIAYIGSNNTANAGDADRPTVWVELGGQLEFLQGTSSPFTAPFMSVTPTPQPYQFVSLTGSQKPSNHAFGLEGRIEFRPEDSDWVFSAGIRYGRSHAKRHLHHQTSLAPLHFTYSVFGYSYQRTHVFANKPFADSRLLSDESHTVLDFQAGKDVGLGMFGRAGSSTISVGVRFAQFSTKSADDIYARPSIDVEYALLFGFIRYPIGAFHAYTMHANAERSFRGIGPSFSWKASAALLGDDHARLDLDWGIDAALLFGRQKAKTSHATQAYYLTGQHFVSFAGGAYVQAYPPRSTDNPRRSRSVIVPNIGGFAGLSVKYPNAKISLGYRADFFFGAVDTGIDARQTKDLGFHGPFATLSIGLGG